MEKLNVCMYEKNMYVRYVYYKGQRPPRDVKEKRTIGGLSKFSDFVNQR